MAGARERVVSDERTPVTIEKGDGRVWEVNVPEPGRITVRHPDGRVEEWAIAEYFEQERRRMLGLGG